MKKDVDQCDAVDARIIMWGKETTFDNKELKLFKPENSDEGCTNYTKPEGSTDNFAMIVTGLNKCPFGNLILNAQQIKASALFVAHHTTGDINGVVLPNFVTGRLLSTQA